ncbi:MAG TPA: discoidin domain-containing protein [Polyangiaceae bacterium]|nr:discoidin domain-containing protein [Polyangiaceae bacterium]
MKGSFRSLGVAAAAAVSWTCSVYDETLLSLQEVTAGGSAGMTAGNAGAALGGGAGVIVAGTKSNVPAAGAAGASEVVAGTGGVPAVGAGGAPAEGGASGAAGETATRTVDCQDAPVPLKGSWRASASHSSLGMGDEYYNPPENLMDLSSKRWSTGKAQAGDEWFQIDLGASAAVRELTMTLNSDDADDYPRSYQVKISDTPLDFNGEIRASGAGALGQTLVVTLAEPVKGRYLLVQQKGKDATSWWSVSELTVACF